MNGSLGFIGVFYMLFWVVIILFLAYVATRFVGKKYAMNLKGKNIAIIESIAMGIDKTLYLVKIGNQFFLISSSGKNINFLSQVDSSNISVIPEGETMSQQMFDIGSFSKQLDVFKKRLINIPSKKAKSHNQIVEEETTNSENLQKNIDRIRDMFRNGMESEVRSQESEVGTKIQKTL